MRIQLINRQDPRYREEFIRPFTILASKRVAGRTRRNRKALFLHREQNRLSWLERGNRL